MVCCSAVLMLRLKKANNEYRTFYFSLHYCHLHSPFILNLTAVILSITTFQTINLTGSNRLIMLIGLFLVCFPLNFSVQFRSVDLPGYASAFFCTLNTHYRIVSYPWGRFPVPHSVTWEAFPLSVWWTVQNKIYRWIGHTAVKRIQHSNEFVGNCPGRVFTVEMFGSRDRDLENVEDGEYGAGIFFPAG